LSDFFSAPVHEQAKLVVHEMLHRQFPQFGHEYVAKLMQEIDLLLSVDDRQMGGDLRPISAEELSASMKFQRILAAYVSPDCPTVITIDAAGGGVLSNRFESSGRRQGCTGGDIKVVSTAEKDSILDAKAGNYIGISSYVFQARPLMKEFLPEQMTKNVVLDSIFAIDWQGCHGNRISGLSGVTLYCNGSDNIIDRVSSIGDPLKSYAGRDPEWDSLTKPFFIHQEDNGYSVEYAPVGTLLSLEGDRSQLRRIKQWGSSLIVGSDVLVQDAVMMPRTTRVVIESDVQLRHPLFSAKTIYIELDGKDAKHAPYRALFAATASGPDVIFDRLLSRDPVGRMLGELTDHRTPAIIDGLKIDSESCDRIYISTKPGNYGDLVAAVGVLTPKCGKTLKLHKLKRPEPIQGK
jgi:hypothetical protein